MSLFSDYYDDEPESDPVETPSTDPNFAEPTPSEEQLSQSVNSEERSRTPEQRRRTQTHDRKDSSGRYDLPDEEDDRSPPPRPDRAPKMSMDPNKRIHYFTDRIVLTCICLVLAAMAGVLIYYGVRQPNNKGNKFIITGL